MIIFPHTVSRRVALRPATSADQADFARTVLRTGVESIRLAVRAAPASNQFNAAFLVTDRAGGEVLGFSVLFGLDAAGHIRCGVYLDPARARLGVGSEAIGLTINYAFAVFDVDRVITESTEASMSSFGMRAGDRRVLNVLNEYVYFRGRYWHLHGFEVSRREWERELTEPSAAAEQDQPGRG